MSAPTVRVVLRGAYSAALDPETGLPRYDAGQPDLCARIQRHGLHVEWSLTAGEVGPELAFGVTLTKGGAEVEATAAAQSPSIQAAARQAVAS